MDERVTAVLEAYHERIRREDREGPVSRPPGSSGDPRDRLLLAVGPETGQFVHILVRSLRAPRILEIGTSYGYSTIWLADAARAAGGRVTTLELRDYKSAYAHEMAVKAGLADHIDFRVGDAVESIEASTFEIDFVLLDLWKDLYVPCLEAFYPKLSDGAIIVADNMLFPGGEPLQRYSHAVRAKAGISSVLLPVGQGIEVSRFEAAR